jgi:hypothetical protein
MTHNSNVNNYIVWYSAVTLRGSNDGPHLEMVAHNYIKVLKVDMQREIKPFSLYWSKPETLIYLLIVYYLPLIKWV